VKLGLAFFASLGLLANVRTASAEPKSLCEARESVVFSCQTGKKILSVCLTAPTTIQYRFGVHGKRPELAYPPFGKEVESAFRFEAESRSAKGNITILQFTNSGVRYTVFRFTHTFEGNYAGVEVRDPNGSVARLSCRESSVVDNLWERLHSLNFAPVPSEEIIE